MKEAKMPVCMTIAGVDPSGGAGMIADVRTFAAFDCFGTAAISSLTFQNTVGVFGAEHQSAECLRQQVQPVIDDIGVDALKTGMLPTLEIIEETARLISLNRLRNIVVDPVVRSTSGFDLIDDEALDALIRTLFPIADLVTPNIPEAERITRSTINNADDIEKAAAAMRSMGARNVLIKGGHATTLVSGGLTMARDYLFLGSELHTIDAVYVETAATHGTGCTLASAITANLALGKGLLESVKIAKEYVNAAIRMPTGLGKGSSPIGYPKAPAGRA